MSALINKLLVFVVLLIIGYAGARKGMLPREFTVSANKLVLNVFMVASILNSVTANPPTMEGKNLLVALGVMSFVMIFSCIVSGLLTRLFHKKDEHESLFEMMVAVMNPMFIGLPVAEVLYGPQSVFYISLINLPFNLLMYTYGVWRLKGKPGEKTQLKWRDFVTAPMVATLLSVVIFLVKPPIPGMLNNLISTMAAATMPLSMVVIGSSLGGVSLPEAVSDGSLYVVAALRLLLMPVLTWLVLRLIPMDPTLYAAAIITAACPSGILVGILSLQYGLDATYSSKGIMLNTFLSMLTIPVIVALFL